MLVVYTLDPQYQNTSEQVRIIIPKVSNGSPNSVLMSPELAERACASYFHPRNGQRIWLQKIGGRLMSIFSLLRAVYVMIETALTVDIYSREARPFTT